MILEPPPDKEYVCPECGTPIDAVTGPRWSWLMLVIRTVTVHPCHHKIDGEGMYAILAQHQQEM